MRFNLVALKTATLKTVILTAVFLSIFSGHMSLANNVLNDNLEAPLIKPFDMPMPVEPPIIQPIEIVTPNNKPINISKLSVDTEILGSFASTTLEFIINNPNAGAISADFQFPIPDRSSVTAFALDVNGNMVDGVIVEKHKARQTFEAITRQRIDPGLIEKKAGNVFSARVFPINTKSSRTIRIQILSELAYVGEHEYFSIPLLFGKEIKQFELNLNAVNLHNKPVLEQKNLENIDVLNWKQGYQAKTSTEQVTFSQPLTIKIPKIKQNSLSNFAQTMVTKDSNSQQWFTINIRDSDLYKALKPSNNKTKVLNKILVVWDASNSREYSNHDLELELLNRFFAQHPNLSVDLKILRNTLSESSHYSVKNSDWSGLKRYLQSITYDGGTNLSELHHVNRKYDAALIFTDGLHTFDRSTPIKLRAQSFVFHSKPSANPAANRKIAEANQGKSFHLQRKEQIPTILSQLFTESYYIESIDVLSGSIELTNELPKKLAAFSNSFLVGKLNSKEAELKLHLSHGQKKQKIIVKLSNSKAYETDLTALLSAQVELENLMVEPKKNKHRIIDLSQRSGLVTDFTSLLVLESLDQYVQYNIAPPESLPEIRKNFFAQQKRVEDNKQEKQKSHLQYVLKEWNNRETWWSTKFPNKPKIEKKKQISRRNRSVSHSELAAPVAAMSADTQERVAVTGSRIAMEELEAGASGKVAGAPATRQASVSIQKWEPSASYVAEIKRENKKERLTKYYSLKKDYKNSPAFYFDVAHLFFKQGQTAEALQVLSNIVELKIKDPRMLRTMASVLKHYQQLDLSLATYELVLLERPEEPQSHRDLALTLQLKARKSNDKDAYQKALNLLNHVVTNPWDRFRTISITALTELNQLLQETKSLELDTSMINQEFLSLMPVNVRITLSWDTDMTDIDLWVIEPNDEKVTYNNKLSHQGGLFFQDYTSGYGPEEYMIKKSLKGQYTIKVHYYGNNSPELSGATNLYATVYTNYGTDQQKEQTITLRLDKANQEYLVGSIEF